MTRHAVAARTLAGALVILTALTSAAPPASAEPKTEATAAATPLAAAALRASESAPSTALVQPTDTTTLSDSDRGFLRTGKGRFLAVLFVAGVAWAAYSAHNDREPVRSPVR